MKNTHNIVRETINLSEEETKEFLNKLVDDELNNAPYENECMKYAYVLGVFQGHVQEMLKKNKQRYLDN
jgi:hypothetical protein